MAKQNINKAQVRDFFIVNLTGGDHNPLPTTAADSPSSSGTVTLTQSAKVKITYGCNFQLNTNMTSYLILNIDGTDVAPSIKNTNPVAGQEYREGSRVYITTLSAGTHTIKLRGLASQANAAVNIAPYWACEVYQ